jgi:hypothetical protein
VDPSGPVIVVVAPPSVVRVVTVPPGVDTVLVSLCPQAARPSAKVRRTGTALRMMLLPDR